MTETEEAVAAVRPTQIQIGTVIESLGRPSPLDDRRLQAAATGSISLKVPGLTIKQNPALASEFGIEAARTLQEQQRHDRLTTWACLWFRSPSIMAASTRMRPSIAEQLTDQITWRPCDSGYPSRLSSRQPTPAWLPFLDIDKIIGDREIRSYLLWLRWGRQDHYIRRYRVPRRRSGPQSRGVDHRPGPWLAQSLGVGELDNTPRPVPMIDTAAGGSLDAMMLDMKNTFDDVVIAHSTPEKAQAILQNQFYVAL